MSAFTMTFVVGDYSKCVIARVVALQLFLMLTIDCTMQNGFEN